MPSARSSSCDRQQRCGLTPKYNNSSRGAAGRAASLLQREGGWEAALVASGSDGAPCARTVSAVLLAPLRGMACGWTPVRVAHDPCSLCTSHCPPSEGCRVAGRRAAGGGVGASLGELRRGARAASAGGFGSRLTAPPASGVPDAARGLSATLLHDSCQPATFASARSTAAGQTTTQHRPTACMSPRALGPHACGRRLRASQRDPHTFCSANSIPTDKPVPRRSVCSNERLQSRRRARPARALPSA